MNCIILLLIYNHLHFTISINISFEKTLETHKNLFNYQVSYDNNLDVTFLILTGFQGINESRNVSKMPLKLYKKLAT